MHDESLPLPPKRNPFAVLMHNVFKLLGVLVFGGVLGILISLFFIHVVDDSFSVVEFASNIHLKFQNNSMEQIYDFYVYSNYFDNVSSDIVDFCIGFEEKDQPECVHQQIDFFYNYTNRTRNRFIDNIRSPSEYKDKGGICRDTAVMHKIIFERLGWYVQYNFPYPQHVNVIISKKVMCDFGECYAECVMEANSYKCNYYAS